VIGANTAAQQRALQMLKTIFDALAVAHRSGTLSAVGTPPPAKRIA